MSAAGGRVPAAGAPDARGSPRVSVTPFGCGHRRHQDGSIAGLRKRGRVHGSADGSTDARPAPHPTLLRDRKRGVASGTSGRSLFGRVKD